MLKLNVGRNKKVPGVEDYSSEGFSCNIEAEVADAAVHDAGSFRQKIDGMFSEAEAAVDRQIELVQQNGQPLSPSPASPNRGKQPKATKRNRRGGNGAAPATNKQINFLIGCARQNQGLTVPQLADVTQTRFGVNDLYSLSKNQASELIDEFKEGA